jgi:methionyl aminopeptidase
MMSVAEDAMWAGIAAARPERRLTDISHEIETTIRGAGRYGIVEGYGGHGIGTEMHQEPHVLNYGRPGRGPKLQHGLVLAVEPMLTLGSQRTRELEDQWTISTADGQPAAHFEHTFAVTAEGPWILTALDGGRAELDRLAASGATATG